jgi:hypothetical protein
VFHALVVAQKTVVEVEPLGAEPHNLAFLRARPGTLKASAAPILVAEIGLTARLLVKTNRPAHRVGCRPIPDLRAWAGASLRGCGIAFRSVRSGEEQLMRYVQNTRQVGTVPSRAAACQPTRAMREEP